MNTETQRLKIQRILAKGETLTPLKALRLCRTFSLSQRIGELRREGWDIRTKLVKVGKSRVASYSLPGARKSACS